MDRKKIFSSVLDPLQDLSFALHAFTLTCPTDILRRRLVGDVTRGRSSPGLPGRSGEPLSRYAGLPTIKIDTGAPTPQETADAICARIPGMPI